MAIQVVCPDCDAHYNFRDEARGKTVRCKKCSNRFIVGTEKPGGDVALREDSADDTKRLPRRRRRPARVRKPAKASTRKILLIGGSVLGALLLLGGAGLGWHLTHKKGTDQTEPDVQDQPDRDAEDQRTPKNIDEALALLKSTEVAKQRSAADWLAKQPVDAGHQTAVAKALDPLLAGPNQDMRLAALQALLVWATKENVPALIVILTDNASGQEQDEIREVALDVVAAVKDPRCAPVVARRLASPKTAEHARKTLQAIGEAAGPEVVKYLFHPDGAVQQGARTLLLAWGTKEGVVLTQVLVEFKSADKTRCRLAANWLATAKLDESRRVEVAGGLDPLLTNADDGVQGAALKAALVWAAPVNVPTLVKIVEDKPDRNRKLAMQVLGKLKDAGGAAAVAARLTDPADRPDATRALKEMGPVATTAVTKYLDHADADVRAEAKVILTSYNSKDNLRLSQALTEIKSPDAEVRRTGARWFAQAPVFAPRRAEAALALEPLLKDKDPEVREPAIKGLMTWGGKDNVPALIEVLSHKDKATRHLALEALGKFKDERAVRPVTARLLSDADRKAASAALVAMGSMCEELVVTCLRNVHRGVRLEACQILEKIGTKKSVPFLQAAIQLYTDRKDAELVAAAEAAAEAAEKR
jgi:predicted Zn finger-like uncharacterized protein